MKTNCRIDVICKGLINCDFRSDLNNDDYCDYTLFEENYFTDEPPVHCTNHKACKQAILNQFGEVK